MWPDYHAWCVAYFCSFWVYTLTDAQCNRLVYANAGKINDIPSIPGI